MKPFESRVNLQHACDLLADGQPLPPLMRTWFVGALRKRLATPTSNLDRLLGLRSRSAGRLHAFSSIPARDQALQLLAGRDGTVTERVNALLKRLARHRTVPDPDLARIERQHGRIPRSRAQLQRILGGHTVASQEASRIACAHLVAPPYAIGAERATITTVPTRGTQDDRPANFPHPRKP